jgi:hypothetical protein
VVTSVPSDAPDDYAALTDAVNKRDKLKLQDSWVRLYLCLSFSL